LYAEDEYMFQKFRRYARKAWQVDTKYNSTELTGKARFTYSDREGFDYMMSRRPAILLQELQEARSREESNSTILLLFLDLDVFLLQDPRPYLHHLLLGADPLDFVGADAQSRSTGPYNAGFLAMRPTEAMVDVVEHWKKLLEKQTNATTNQHTFNNVVRRLGDTVHHQLLPRAQFSVGKIFLHERKVSSTSLNRSEVVAFHNNFCAKKRHCTKPQRAKRLGLWRPIEYQELLV
jgi:hypothetical protein